jgi:HlyD family secretion protein
LQVWASVNEADVGNIRPGQPVGFRVAAFPGERFEGKVIQVRLNAAMTQNVVTYTVVVGTDNTDGRLLPYMTAALDFEVQRRTSVLRVPSAALRWQPALSQVAPGYRAEYSQPSETGSAKSDFKNQGRVWVEEGKFVRPISVRVGISDGVLTEIVDRELKEGAQVVIGEIPDESASDSGNPFAPKLPANK